MSRRATERRSDPPASSGSMNRLLIAGAVLSTLALILAFLLLTPPTPSAPSETNDALPHPAAGQQEAVGEQARMGEPLAAAAPPKTLSLALPTTPVEMETETEQKRLLDEVEQAVKRYPHDASAFYIGALTYKELLQTQRSGELFKRSLELDANNSEVLVAYARMLAQAGKQDEAVTLLSQAVDRGLSSAPLLTALGEANSETGELEGAVKNLQQAITLAPEHSPAHLPLAQTLIQLERFAEAEEHARIALRQDPTNRAGFVALSTALIRQDKKDEALKVRSEMPKIESQVMPDDNKYQQSFRSFAASTYSMLGKLYAAHDSLTLAEQVLVRSLELDPSAAGSAVLLGELVRREGRIGDSIAVYQRLTEIQPENLINFHNLASLAVSAGDLPLAETTLRKAAQADASGNAELQLARFLLGMGNIREGVAHAERAALRLGSVDAYLVSIAAHRAAGDTASALSDYLKAKAIAPSDPRLANFTP